MPATELIQEVARLPADEIRRLIRQRQEEVTVLDHLLRAATKREAQARRDAGNVAPVPQPSPMV